MVWAVGLRGAVAYGLALNLPQIEGESDEGIPAIESATLVIVMASTLFLGAATGPLLRVFDLQVCRVPSRQASLSLCISHVRMCRLLVGAALWVPVGDVLHATSDTPFETRWILCAQNLFAGAAWLRLCMHPQRGQLPLLQPISVQHLPMLALLSPKSWCCLLEDLSRCQPISLC
jgi:hypothetical protein